MVGAAQVNSVQLDQGNPSTSQTGDIRVTSSHLDHSPKPGIQTTADYIQFALTDGPVDEDYLCTNVSNPHRQIPTEFSEEEIMSYSQWRNHIRHIRKSYAYKKSKQEALFCMVMIKQNPDGTNGLFDQNGNPVEGEDELNNLVEKVGSIYASPDSPLDVDWTPSQISENSESRAYTAVSGVARCTSSYHDTPRQSNSPRLRPTDSPNA